MPYIETVMSIPIITSSFQCDVDEAVNKELRRIQHTHSIIDVHEELCGPVDPYKFLFAFTENPDGFGEASCSYGIVTIKPSTYYEETEKRINDVFTKLRMDTKNPTQFINIFHPTEYSYIVFYKTGGGYSSYPVAKIRTIDSDPKFTGRSLSKFLTDLKEKEGLFPYDKIMIDTNHVMYLCGSI